MKVIFGVAVVILLCVWMILLLADEATHDKEER